MLIRTRITIASLAATLVAVTALGVASYSGQRAADARFIEASLSSKRVLLDQLIVRHASEMGAHMKAVTRDSVALKALRSGDLATLQDQVDTTHNMFFSDQTIDRLQIFSPEGDYLASAPKGFSGKTRKALVTDVVKDGSRRFGLVVDDDGELQASIAFPLYARGKMKGVAVFSREAQRIVDDFRQYDGSDVFLLDNKSEVRNSARDNSYGPLSMVPEDVTRGTVDIERQGKTYLAVSSVPIQLGSGEHVGTLISVEDQTESFGRQATANYVSSAVVLSVVLLSAVGLFWYIRRAFDPINVAIDSMTSISEGQLHCSINSNHGNDETGQLTAALCRMVNQLRELISDITASSESLTDASRDLREISDGNTSSIAIQSEETDQLATAINEMTATVQEVAASALAAADSTTSASDNADEGRDIVEQTINAITVLADDIERAGSVIERLRQESESIGGVLEVIRTISEQTNLLALNAAIEAARAGEYGRGFAVVADEVRTLASRTQNSTQEIQDMIQRLQSQATEAVEVIAASRASSSETVEQAAKAGHALEEITASANSSNAMNKQIARAAEEQHSVAEMINSSVSHIAQLAEASKQRTAQATKAAESTAELSAKLGSSVHRFQL